MSTPDPSPRQLETGEIKKEHDGGQCSSPVGEESIEDPNIVDWDGPDDPANPMNWSRTKKNMHVGIVSCFTLAALVIPFH